MLDFIGFCIILMQRILQNKCAVIRHRISFTFVQYESFNFQHDPQRGYRFRTVRKVWECYAARDVHTAMSCTVRFEVTGFKGMGMIPHLKILGEKKSPNLSVRAFGAEVYFSLMPSASR